MSNAHRFSEPADAECYSDLERFESDFDKLKNSLAHRKDAPRDPAAVAAAIGRKKLGQAEMTRRSVAGREK